jgi:fructokinase
MRLGVDLGGTKISAAVIDATGVVVAERRMPTPLGDYDAVVDAVAGIVGDVEQELGAAVTVGVGVPGSIDPVGAEIRNANTVSLNGRSLGEDLAAAVGREVRVANDADCFALSEAADGAGSGHRTVFGAILGTGAGGGIVVDGRLLGGPNAITGEWGHVPLPWPRPDELPGPACYCGRWGCLEMFVSGPGLERDHAERTGDRRPPAELAELAAGGDGEASLTMLRHADRLARSLAVVMNILDPDVVVLGGGLSNLGHLYDDVPALWDRYVFADVVRTRLVRARHGDDSGVRGAAWLWGSVAP